MRKMSFLALAAALAVVPVASAKAESPAEKAIAQQIGVRLKASGELHNYRIGVKYQDGVAWLTGSVTSAEQRDAAMRLARQTDGVTHVVCRLETPSPMPGGGDLHSALQQAGMSQSGRSTSVSQAVGRPGGAVGMQGGTGRQAMSNAMQSGMSGAQRQASPNGNMPLPAHRLAMNPPIRQVSAHAHHGHGPMNAGGMNFKPGGAVHAGGAVAGGGANAVPVGFVPGAHGGAPAYDSPQMPGYAWPSYASYPNYGALTYPRQYSPTAWPYIGPFYPYPQVPLGWRKVTLEWDDGWWFLDFSHAGDNH